MSGIHRCRPLLRIREKGLCVPGGHGSYPIRCGPCVVWEHGASPTKHLASAAPNMLGGSVMTTRGHARSAATLALIILAAVVLAACGVPSSGGSASEPIMIGVSGPLTGDNAQYGAQWKKGFDLGRICKRLVNYCDASRSLDQRAVGASGTAAPPTKTKHWSDESGPSSHHQRHVVDFAHGCAVGRPPSAIWHTRHRIQSLLPLAASGHLGPHRC